MADTATESVAESSVGNCYESLAVAFSDSVSSIARLWFNDSKTRKL